MTRNQYGRHVCLNYLPHKIKFGIFRQKLANKLQESQESLDRHRLQWSYRLNGTGTINAILMTSFDFQT